ncbi:miraculin-like [Benincasa hispida]|uniref:miraculin-like n=1 Tax=Benincasa hispida TaxID=102211 RepID=UPI001900A75A|nr:miraculin-like [Benincasa hispida]
MKSFELLSLIFIVIVASTERQQFCRVNASPEAILDTNGKKLRGGDHYYILPFFSRNTGGLALGNIQREYSNECPLNVVPEPYEYFNGLPTTFSPVNPKKGVIRVSTDLNIQFERNTMCAKSTVWKISKFEQQYLVTIGGTKGDPGPETMENWFKIEKYNNNNIYKFVYCPTVCKYCKVMCKDVGIFVKNGRMALALSDAPFPVMFKKVYK